MTGRREDEADAGHADARRRHALPRRRGARRLRGAERELFFWLGGARSSSSARSPTSSTARSPAPASKGTVFGAFLDSTFDRLGEAAMLARDRARLHARGQRHRARRGLRRRDRLVPRLVHAREGGGARAARRRRLRLARRARRPDLGRPRPRAVGCAAVADLPPRAMAWITVLQRILFVRRQLRDSRAS